MALVLDQLRQVSLPSTGLDNAIPFYRDKLGLELLATFDPPGLAFFRLGSTRLLLDASNSGPVPEKQPPASVLYFGAADVHAVHRALVERGVRFDAPPQRIFTDHEGAFGPAGEEEWTAFFRDPDGNVLAIASRTPPSGDY